MDQDETARRIDEFHRAYIFDPDFVEQCYELPAVSELAALPGVHGVTRFVEIGSFEPERLFTLVYQTGAVEVSAVVGASSLWWSKPAVLRVAGSGPWKVEAGDPFEPLRGFRRSAVLPLPSRKCPLILSSWNSVRAAAALAPTCSTETLDGISFRHRVVGEGVDMVANWDNPARPDHSPQLTLVTAYVALLRRLWFYPR